MIRKNKSSVIIDSTSAGISMVGGMDTTSTSRTKDGGTIGLNVTEFEMMKIGLRKLDFGKIILHEGKRWFIQPEVMEDNQTVVRFSMLERVTKNKCTGRRAFILDNKHYLILTSVTHSLQKSKGMYWWNVIGNPTSAMSGSNVRPVQFKKKELTESLRHMMSFCFRFLLEITGLNLSDLNKRVNLGFFTMHNVQFATYMPMEQKKEVLNLLSSVYGLGVVDKAGKFSNFASLLGFDYKSYEKVFDPSMLNMGGSEEEGPQHTGFMLTKKKPNGASVFTINLYDKEAQSEYTGLSGLSNPKNDKLIGDTVRVDITLHKLFFPVLFRAASKLNSKIDFYTNEKNYDIDPSANNICRAVAAIEELYPSGFTGWLVREILVDRMCMFSVWPILDFEYDILEEVKQFLDREEKTSRSKVDFSKVYDSWEKSSKSETIIECLKEAGVSSSTMYEIGKRLELETGLSPHIPFLVVVAMRSEMATAGFSSAEYHAFYLSMKSGDYSKFDFLVKQGKELINKVVKQQREKSQAILRSNTRTGMKRMAAAPII